MSCALHPFLERTLRRLFEPVFHERGEESPAICEVVVSVPPEVGWLEILVEFEDGTDRRMRVPEGEIMRRADSPWRSAMEFADDVQAHAHRVWSIAFEDHLMRRTRRSMQETVREAQRTFDPRAESLYHLFQEHSRHLERFHLGIDPADPMGDRTVFQFWHDGGVPATIDRITGTENVPGSLQIRQVSLAEMAQTLELRPDPLTSTEVARRVEIARRLAEMNRRWEETVRNALFGSFEPGGDMADAFAYFRDALAGEVGSPEARAKGLALLKEHLTPAQSEQYEKHQHFDVKGGASGKTYRIHHGRQMNIAELGKDGNPVSGLCFLPQGGLVAGDVMLAQKAALEMFEEKALGIANRFSTPPGSRLNPHPLRPGAEYAGPAPATMVA